jgi:hypothetical protein
MLTCMYCKTQTINCHMWVVREAIKPVKESNRWVKLGYCCDACENAGAPLNIDKFRKVKP